MFWKRCKSLLSYGKCDKKGVTSIPEEVGWTTKHKHILDFEDVLEYLLMQEKKKKIYHTLLFFEILQNLSPCSLAFFSFTEIMPKSVNIFLCYQGLPNYYETILQDVDILTEEMSTRGLKFITQEELLQSFCCLGSNDNWKGSVKWNSKGKVRNTWYFHYSFFTFLTKELKFYWTFKVSLKWLHHLYPNT